MLLDKKEADRPENLLLLTAAASTWLYRKYGWSSFRGKMPLTPALVQHIEVVDYLNNLHVNLFAHTLDMLGPVLTRLDYQALFLLALDQLVHFDYTALYTILPLMLRRLTPKHTAWHCLSLLDLQQTLGTTLSVGLP